MFTATINARGQITIPAEVRNALKLNAGAQIWFEEERPGVYAIKRATKLPVTALKGMFGKHTPAVSIEQMNSSIAKRGIAALDKLDSFFDSKTATLTIKT